MALEDRTEAAEASVWSLSQQISELRQSAEQRGLALAAAQAAAKAAEGKASDAAKAAAEVNPFYVIALHFHCSLF